MAFDVEKLFKFAASEIEKFAGEKKTETFYAFAIDASLLCLNSEESASRTLKKYREKWDTSTREVKTWDELTTSDLREAEYLLRLAEQYSGLDRGDKDACLRVVNESRAKQRAEGNPHIDKGSIESLRENTGDWEYQGFATMKTEHGFDDDKYDKHYDLDETKQRKSEYAIAMNTLVERLVKSGVFNCLNLSADFKAQRVEHNY